MKARVNLLMSWALLTIASTVSAANREWIHQPSDRHNGGANLSFADGHVEPHQWRWPKRLGYSPTSIPVANALDLEDLRWLQARLPEP